jgi:hypothetical protein
MATSGTTAFNLSIDEIIEEVMNDVVFKQTLDMI